MMSDDEAADFGLAALLQLAAPKLYEMYGKRPAATYQTWLSGFLGVTQRRLDIERAVEPALRALLAALPQSFGEQVPRPITEAARRILGQLGHTKSDAEWDDCGTRIAAEDDTDGQRQARAEIVLCATICGYEALARLATPEAYSSYGRIGADAYREALDAYLKVLPAGAAQEEPLRSLISALPAELGAEVPLAIVDAARHVLALVNMPGFEVSPPNEG